VKAIIYQHEVNEPLGLLEKPLSDAGFSLVRRFREADYADVGAALVVVLGGNMSANDVDAHRFLNDEVSVLAERLRLNRPTVGICLGAQLLARAAGSSVFAGKNGPEIGAQAIRLTAAANVDSVLRGLPQKLFAAQLHSDTFSKVEGALVLASSDRYVNQAFKLGESYGFQFHPEVSPAEFEKWLTVALDARAEDLKSAAQSIAKLKAAEPHWTLFREQLAHHCAQAAVRTAT
jgi:GMP synthase (glutamine-hydrolysing)